MKKENIPIEVINLLTEKEILIFKELQLIINELNQKTNLTRLIENEDYWISQVYDSIWPFKINSKDNFDNKRFIDIGSGYGFPGFGYAITHPNSEIYLVDSSQKKIDCLKTIVNNINFKNKFFIINDRIENFSRKSLFKNSFDIATARALSKPSTVAEYIIPTLNQKGHGLIYCGKWNEEDQNKLEKTLDILEGELVEIKQNSLPKKRGTRTAIFIQPKGICPKAYPRGIGKAEKYPIAD